MTPMTTQRSFMPNDIATVNATSDANGTVVHRNADWRSELAEYNKYRDINRLMRQRHGVNM